MTTFALAMRIALLFLLLCVGVLVVIYGTSVRNRWGINVNIPVRCPHCNAQGPWVRIPKSLREFLWGGGTCKSCGTRYDKWGRALESGPTQAMPN